MRKRGFLIIIGVISCMFSFAQTGMIKSEFVYVATLFPSCHASTIVEADNGDLLVAYFGGKYEGADDVCVWLSRKMKDSSHWLAPVMIADGTPCYDLKERKACYNPVLYKMPDGTIVLFFKIGKHVQDWTGWVSFSSDNGYTWTDKKPLPAGYLGAIKNKPELIANKLICPSSTEAGWWQIHFEIYDLDTKTWQYVGPIKANKAISTMDMPNGKRNPIICIQPSILKLSDGRLQVLCRTKNGRLATSYSKDSGNNWSKVTLTNIPNNNSGTDAVTLKNGNHALVYNNVSTANGEEMGKRTPLILTIFDSTMNKQLQTIVLEDDPDGEYSYPAIIQGSNGNLYVTYTWRRQKIAFKEIRL